MTRELIYQYEKELIFLLNQSGWQVKWSEDKYCLYDAIGTDKNGQSCVMEFKFRRKYYKSKILETKKYNALLAQNKEMYYCVIDQKGCHIYDLAQLNRNDLIELKLPKETITDNIQKESRWVYEIKQNPNYFYRFQFF